MAPTTLSADERYNRIILGGTTNSSLSSSRSRGRGRGRGQLRPRAWRYHREIATTATVMVSPGAVQLRPWITILFGSYPSRTTARRMCTWH